MKDFKRLFYIFLSIFVAAFAFIFPFQENVRAVSILNCNGNAASTVACQGKDDKLFGPNSFWNKVTNTLLLVLGSIAVLMIIVGGMRYSLSSGDQSQVTAGKNTIIYSIVGLILSLMAGGIVNFVLVNI